MQTIAITPRNADNFVVPRPRPTNPNIPRQFWETGFLPAFATRRHKRHLCDAFGTLQLRGVWLRDLLCEIREPRSN